MLGRAFKVVGLNTMIIQTSWRTNKSKTHQWERKMSATISQLGRATKKFFKVQFMKPTWQTQEQCNAEMELELDLDHMILDNGETVNS